MKKFYALLIAVMALFISLTACAGDFATGGYQNIQTEQPAINGCTTCHKAEKAEAIGLAVLSDDIWRLDKQAGSTRTISELSNNIDIAHPMDTVYRKSRSGHVHDTAYFAVKLKPDISIV